MLYEETTRVPMIWSVPGHGDQKSASTRTSLYRFTQYNDGATGQEANPEDLYNHAGTAYSFDPWEARDLRSVSPASRKVHVADIICYFF